MMLLRTDPSRHRLVYLSIPRDLRRHDPGLRRREDQRRDADRRPEARDQDGRTTLLGLAAADQPRRRRRLRLVRKLIDAVGGIDVNVPENDPLQPLRLPVLDAGALRPVAGLALRQGRAAHGRAPALIYSRIRENRLNPADTDVTRGQHQQQVMQATLSKLASAVDVLPAAVQRRRR